MIPDRDGIYPDIPEDMYHADRASLSVSGAKLLLPPGCPALFRERMDNPPPPKPEFNFGSLVHKLVLGKGAEIEVIDAPDYRTKAAREARDQAHAAGKIPALVDEIERARVMAQRVREHPVAGALFAQGEAEVAMYATDPESGVRLRGRADWIRADSIVDYKTSSTANPDELVRLFWSYGYHMQAAWYIDVCELAGVIVEPEFVFVVQEKTPPYLVTVVRYDAEAITEGRRLNRQAIRLYAECVESGVWPGYTDSVVSLSLPRWALTDSIQTDADALIAELEEIA